MLLFKRPCDYAKITIISIQYNTIQYNTIQYNTGQYTLWNLLCRCNVLRWIRCLCDVTLSVYPHRAGLENMPGHGGIRTYDLWNTSPMLCQLSYSVRTVRVCDISELSLVPSISVHIYAFICSMPFISQELDSVPKYRILEPSWPRSSVGRALG